MSTEAIQRGRAQTAASPEDRDERARLAVKVFRTMQHGLSSYARAITGNKKVRVQVDGGVPRTDGTVIYYRPPIELGDRTPHNRAVCDQRHPDTGLLVCPACKVREEVLVNIYHEIAHIAFGTFTPTSERAKVNAIELAVTEWGGDYADKIRKVFAAAPNSLTASYMGLATLISPFLPHLVNCIEDARVDSTMFEKRKGTRKMLEADTYSLFRDGIPQADGTLLSWMQAPMNSQAAIACYLAGAGYAGWQDFLHPDIGTAFADPQLAGLVAKIAATTSASETYHLAFPILARLRELGYFLKPEEQKQEEPEPEQDEEEQDESDEQSPDADPEDRDEAEQGESGEGDDGDPSDGGSDREPGDPADDESGDSGDSGGKGASDQPADDGDPDAGGSAGDGTDEGDSGSESPDSGPEGDEASDSGDAAPDAGSDGAPEDASDGSDGPGAESPEGSDIGGNDRSDERSVQEGSEVGDPGQGDGGSNQEDADTDADSAGGSDPAVDSPEQGDGEVGDGEGGEAPDGDEASTEPADSGQQEGADDSSDPAGDDPDTGDSEGSEERGSDSSGAGAASDEEKLTDGEASADGGGDQQDASGDGEGDDVSAQAEPGKDGGEHQLEEPATPSGPAGVDYDSDGEGAPQQGDERDPASGDEDDLPESDGEAAGPEETSPELTPEDRGDEPFDSGADEGLGGIEVKKAEPRPDMGTADDVKEDLERVHGEIAQADKAEWDAKEDTAAVTLAILQGLYFETPSANVSQVNLYDSKTTGPAWDMWDAVDDEDADGHSAERRFLGIECDMDIPEQVMGPALLKLRRVFSDNQLAAHEHNRRSGRVDKRVLGRRAWSGDDRLFTKKRLPGKRNYAVLIGIDISSSTLGNNLALAKRAAFAQADLCQRLGIDFAVFAHSGHGFRTYEGGVGHVEYGMDIYTIKAWDQPWNTEAIDRITKIGGVAGNLDGHTMEFYRKQLDAVQATDKVLMYYTDGKMPAANHDEELEVLQREIKTCKQRGYTLMAVGIRTDSPIRHGLDTCQINDDDDLKGVVDHLGKRLGTTAR